MVTHSSPGLLLSDLPSVAAVGLSRLSRTCTGIFQKEVSVPFPQYKFAVGKALLAALLFAISIPMAKLFLAVMELRLEKLPSNVAICLSLGARFYAAVFWVLSFFLLGCRKPRRRARPSY